MSNDKFRPLFGDDENAPSDDSATTENRRFKRLALASDVTIYDGERRRHGQVHDISGSGACLTLDSEIENLDQPPNEGRYIDIDINIGDIMYVGGQVVRHEDNGFAVRFDLDDNECADLANEIVNQQTTISN